MSGNRGSGRREWHFAYFALVLVATTPRVGAQQAIQADREMAEEALLDVSVEVFDPGAEMQPGNVPPKQDGQVVLPDLRRAESRFLAVELMATLQSTGYWGAVRVVPEGAAVADLRVAGEIVKSNGKDLVVRIEATDASGRRWLEKKYRQEADWAVYQGEDGQDRDPYHGIYAEIANDLLAELRAREMEELVELRRIAKLRFASDIAPSTFADYLRTDRRGHYELARLPAAGDPMFDRVARIRERDFMFVDTLNEHYVVFGDAMEEAYDNWRAFSYEEQLALEELKRKARNRKILGALAILGGVIAPAGGGLESAARDAAIIGGMAAIQSGIAKGKEAKIHAEALRELASSFEAEVTPMVVDVEGKTVELRGSREEQFTAWRDLLRQIWVTETGLPVDPNEALGTREGETPIP